MAQRNNRKPLTVAGLLMPYGMREIFGYGPNVWEFFNRDYNVIGLPFRLARRPSDSTLLSVSWNGVIGAPMEGESRTVFFTSGGLEMTDAEFARVRRVLGWKLHRLEGEVQQAPAQVYPHSFGRDKGGVMPDIPRAPKYCGRLGGLDFAPVDESTEPSRPDQTKSACTLDEVF